MPASLRTRFSATLMLLLFVLMGGGLGASGLDALLFHLTQREQVADIHIEAAEAACHAQSCLIGCGANGGRFLSTTAQSSHVRSADRSVEALEPCAAPAPLAWIASPLPRSPPRLTL